MLHLFLQSSLIGSGFIIGVVLTLIFCSFFPRKEESNFRQEMIETNRKNCAALLERNTQWRPSQLDFFAAAAMQGDWAAQDGSDAGTGYFLDSVSEEQYAAISARYYKHARAMVVESESHRSFLPPVPDFQRTTPARSNAGLVD